MFNATYTNPFPTDPTTQHVVAHLMALINDVEQRLQFVKANLVQNGPAAGVPSAELQNLALAIHGLSSVPTAVPNPGAQMIPPGAPGLAPGLVGLPANVIGLSAHVAHPTFPGAAFAPATGLAPTGFANANATIPGFAPGIATQGVSAPFGFPTPAPFANFRLG